MQLLSDWILGRDTVYVALPTRKLMPAQTPAFLDFASERVPFGNRRETAHWGILKMLKKCFSEVNPMTPNR